MPRRAILGLPAVLSTGISGSQFDPLAIILNRFANRYNQFIQELRGGKLSLRDCKALSKLWREVENSGNWPKAEGC